MTTSGEDRERRSAIRYWWESANEGTRQRAREAGYYAGAPLPPALVATFSRAGVDLVDAHRVAPAGGGPRGYYLSPEDVEALRWLGGPHEQE